MRPAEHEPDSDLPEPDDPFIGREVGDYLIESRLGQGGMGAVFRARDLAIDRRVALKIMLDHLAGDRDARTRFQREIQNAAAVEHPNVVPIYNAGFDGQHFFIAMRLIEGPDLADIIAGGPLPIDRALRITRQVGSALARIHEHALIHRDVKPANILIAEAGSSEEFAALTDFGISRALNSVTALTRGMIGTAEYMAPEVVKWLPATPRSDQYSLACVLFEMLSGHSPFEGEDLPAAHVDAPVPTPPASCDATAATALRRALSKDPEDRFGTVGEFISALEHVREYASQSAPRAGRRRGPVAPTPTEPAGTLHLAIQNVLRTTDGWMATRDLARAINAAGTYTKRDGTPITGSQVAARVTKYPDLFERNGPKVRLRRA